MSGRPRLRERGTELRRKKWVSEVACPISNPRGRKGRETPKIQIPVFVGCRERRPLRLDINRRWSYLHYVVVAEGAKPNRHLPPLRVQKLASTFRPFFPTVCPAKAARATAPPIQVRPPSILRGKLFIIRSPRQSGRGISNAFGKSPK